MARRHGPDGRDVGRRRRRTAPMLAPMLTLAAAACVSLPPQPAGLASRASGFSPESFFAGKTEGVGTVRVAGSGRHALHVLGTGRVETDGALLLDQLVDEDGKPPEQREWRIRRVSPGRYAGTLSDAAGPVAGEIDGNMLHLRFRMAGGLDAEQRLYLQRDGRTAINRMTVRKLGLVVAVIEETIRKVG